MPRQIEYAITDRWQDAKVFKSYAAARAAARRWAVRMGLPESYCGAGFLGDGRYTAYIDGRGWLTPAARKEIGA